MRVYYNNNNAWIHKEEAKLMAEYFSISLEKFLEKWLGKDYHEGELNFKSRNEKSN